MTVQLCCRSGLTGAREAVGSHEQDNIAVTELQLLLAP